MESGMFVSVKVSNVAPMKQGEYYNLCMASVPENLDSMEDGYMIVFENNLVEWWTADKFKRRFAPVNEMVFGDAIEAAKNGHKIARKGWNGKNMFVVYMPALKLPPYNTADVTRKVNDRTAKFIGEDTPLDCQPYFAMYNAQKQWIPGWVASQSDMLAEDWFILE